MHAKAALHTFQLIIYRHICVVCNACSMPAVGIASVRAACRAYVIFFPLSHKGNTYRDVQLFSRKWSCCFFNRKRCAGHLTRSRLPARTTPLNGVYGSQCVHEKYYIYTHWERERKREMFFVAFGLYLNKCSCRSRRHREKSAEREVERLDYTHFTLNDTTGVLLPLLLTFFRICMI